MDKDETHNLMNTVVDGINAYSLNIFEHTNCDTAVVGIIASKEHGQMLINGPFETENLIGLMLTVVSGAGESIGIISEKDHRYISTLASKLYKDI